VCGFVTGFLISVEVVLTFLRAVGVYPFGDGVAVDAEGFGRVGNALFVPREGFLDIQLFEFPQGFIQRDVTIKHFFDYCL